MKKIQLLIPVLLFVLLIACNRDKVLPDEIYNIWDRERLSTTIDDERFIFFTDGKFVEMRKGVNDVVWSENLLTGSDPVFKVTKDSIFLYLDTDPQNNKFYVKKYKLDRLTATKLSFGNADYNAVK